MLEKLFGDRLTRLLQAACITIDGPNPWDIRVNDSRMFRKTVLEGNLGFGESYMDGWWECDDLDELFYRIVSSGIDQQLVTLTKTIKSIQSTVRNLQKPTRAFTVGKRHYDTGNELFQAMLDPLMLYTCGYWHKTRELEQAQRNKLTLVFDKLRLEPAMTLLDIGCGWGGAARFAAEKYGAKVLGITVSQEQARFASNFCRSANVEIRLMDYRELTGTFDRIVSLGMLEHVGYRNYRLFFETAKRCLHPEGLLLVQTIGSNTPTTANDPWIEKYIFPNSLLPAASQLARAYERHFILEDWHSFGHDYSRTLKAWEANFRRHWPRLEHRYDDRFYRMWRYYLLSCSGAFRARTIQLWQILFSPSGIRGDCRVPHEPSCTTSQPASGFRASSNI